MQSGYEWLMRRAMPRKALTLGVAAGAFGMGLLMIRAIPQRFFPSAERNQFIVDVWTPEGSRLESTDSTVERIASAVRGTHDVRTVATFVGAGSPRFYYNVNPEPPASNYGQLLVNTTSAEATSRLVGSLRDVSTELYDAMTVDGAGPFRIMMQLVIPMSKGAIAAVGTYTALGAWNQFLFPLILTQDPSMRVLTLSLTSFKQEFQINVPGMMMAVMLTALPVFILYLVARRWLIAGLAGMGSK